MDAGGFVVNSANLINDFKIDGTLKWQMFTFDLTYTIKKDDNLTDIAKRLNTTVEELAKQNNIEDVNTIKEGDSLKYSHTVYGGGSGGGGGASGEFKQK